MNLYFKTALATIFIQLLFLGPQSLEAQSKITLDNGNLKAVFVDNGAYGVHRNGYNGIAELYHINQDSTLFVPFYAGLNLEHIFAGDSLISLFEPRKEPMSLKRKSKTKVLLHQPTTQISQVESWTTFEMKNPNYIDMEFRVVIHDREFFNHNYAGFFWASYINLPKERGIYFKGRKRNQSESGDWLYAFSTEHGKDGTHISEKDTYEFYMAPNFNVVLAKEKSDYTFTEPYYYGRFHNMVFAYLFPKPDEGIIRMTQSPTGGGSGKPAWDFQFILPEFEVGKEYTFKIRVVYKKWIDQKDIEQEYAQWVKED